MTVSAGESGGLKKVVCDALSSSLALTTSALDIVMLQEEPGHSGKFSREMAFTVLYTEKLGLIQTCCSSS